MKRKILTVFFLAAFCLMAFQANAVAYVNIQFINPGSGGYPLAENYSGYMGGESYSDAAGTYELRMQGVANTFWGFCVDPATGSFEYKPYTLQAITDPIEKAAAWLANSYQSGLLSTMYTGQFSSQSELAAATQTAIWELILDTGLNVSPTNGNTYTYNSWATLAQNLVNEAYSNHQNFDASGWRWAHSPEGIGHVQDLLIPNVPIPGAVWLLGSGLLGLVAIRRRFK